MSTNEELPIEMVAAITAAVYMVMGAKARITSVQPAHPMASNFDLHMLNWSLEGRRQIHSARKVR